MSCYDEEAPTREDYLRLYLRLMESEKEARAKHHELCVQVKKMLKAYYRARDRADQHHYTRHGAQDYWKIFTERRERVEQLTLK